MNEHNRNNNLDVLQNFKVLRTTNDDLINDIKKKDEYLFRELKELSHSDENRNDITAVKTFLNSIKSELEGVNKSISIEESEGKIIYNEHTSNEDGLKISSQVLAHYQMANSTAQFVSTWINSKISNMMGKGSSGFATWLTGTFTPWLTGTLLPWLGNQLQLIFSIIQKMTTISQWKIKGKMGTGFLGFADAEIEISFIK